MDVSEIEGPFFRAGADGVLLEEFRALADAGRFPAHPVLKWLARFVVGMGGGPNKDSPLVELCHLVHAIDILTGNEGESRQLFFLGLDRAVPRTIRTHLVSLTIAPVDGPVSVDGKGVVIDYPDSPFRVTFGRMPFLVALYEFLTAMEGFSFYEDLGEILNGMTASGGPVSTRAVKDAANRIASRLRVYRREHMEWAANDEKFDAVLGFLKDHADDGHFIIDDEAIFDFWRLHSQGKEFRGYKTVFDAFVTFQRALRLGDRSQSAEQASVMGTDVEAGEVDLADEAFDLETLGDWASPLDAIDDEDLQDIKFFKGSSERKPMEALMTYGPDAVRLPRAFLRLESFAPIQSGITNDLQVKRGRDSVSRRIACTDAETYDQKRNQYAALLSHVRNLEKAVLHALVETRDTATVPLHGARGLTLAEDEGLPDMNPVAEEAREAFRKLVRKGFEEITDPGDHRGEAFRRAAAPLVTIAHVLQSMLDAADDLGAKSDSLQSLFSDDKSAFSMQFAAIYGDAQ
ncbi:MAG: hypothetical protein CMM77_00345 [Rhodospirillaceae bacterium]|nr:hypothetical protein [Magnetovibrio sp.]MAY65556.1 hypothetical protein [Rhodospirillaceae bacterium]